MYRSVGTSHESLSDPTRPAQCGGVQVRAPIWLPCLLSILVIPAARAERVTQADLLHRLIDLDRLVLPPPAGERTGLFSSYDRRQSTIREGRYVHWDATNDRGQFLRTTDDGWNVMAEIKSPGALTRIWCQKPTGDVRIVLDGEPVIDAPLLDLFDGGVEPFGMPLSYVIPPGDAVISYFPIGFARSCRVLSREFTGEYQIDYVACAPTTVVECFQPQLGEQARAALDEVSKTLRRGLSEKQLHGKRRTAPHGGQKNLKGGDKLEWDLTGAGTIRTFQVSLTDKREPRERHALHNLILRIFWDGRTQPDVELPLTAFFGTGFTRNLYNSLVMGTDLATKMPGEFANEGWFMYCYFPMPFTDGAHIEIENQNVQKNREIGVMLYMQVERDAPPANALRFKARMRTEDPCQTFDFPMLETTQPGRLVGCVLNIDCPREQWWGAGDHKIWLDDEPFPSILGTSTAGYFGNVTGLRPIRMPLHGATLVSPIGKNSMYRWQLADCGSFQKSLRFTLENWQYDRADDVYYNSVVYWYGQPGAPDAFEPLSPEMLKLAGLRIPGAVEIEGNNVSSDWGSVKKQKHAGGLEFSGEAAATITTRNPVRIEIPWNQPGKYRLGLRVQTGRSFGTVAVSHTDGNPIGRVEYSRQSDGTYSVGEIVLNQDKTSVIVQCSKTTVLDCWVLEPAE